MKGRLSGWLSLLPLPSRLEDLGHEQGQTTAEYAIIAGMLIVLTVAVFAVLSGAVAAYMQNAAIAIAKVILP